jgi:Rha family phage regulatory protein
MSASWQAYYGRAVWEVRKRLPDPRTGRPTRTVPLTLLVGGVRDSQSDTRTFAMTSTAITPSAVSIHIIDGQPVTTSLDIARHFGKRHDTVLRAIKNLDCSPEFTDRNFAVCYENNKLQNGKPQPFYRMTRDGFVFLCMGFTGREAARWKEAYIEAFNKMEAELFDRAMQHIDDSAREDCECPYLHAPMSHWVETNPWLKANLNGPFGKPPTTLTISANAMLCDDYRSPIQELLDSLKRSGRNVSACENELSAMRMSVRQFQEALLSVQKTVALASNAQFQFRMG